MATLGDLPAPLLTPSSPTSPSTTSTSTLRKRREPSPLPEPHVVLKSQKAEVNSTANERRERGKKHPGVKRSGYSSDTSSRKIVRKRKTEESPDVAVDPPAKREQLSVSDGEGDSNELEAARLRLKQKIAVLRAARSKKRNASRTTTARATSTTDATTTNAVIIKNTWDVETSPKLTESTCDGSTTAGDNSTEITSISTAPLSAATGEAAQVVPVKSSTVAEEPPSAEKPVTSSTSETADQTAAVKKSVLRSGRAYLLGHGSFAERQTVLPFYHPPGTVMERLALRMRFEAAPSSGTPSVNKISTSTLDLAAGYKVTGAEKAITSATTSDVAGVEKANTSATTFDAISASAFDSAAGRETTCNEAITLITTSTVSATAALLAAGIAAPSQHDETGLVIASSTASQMRPADRAGSSDDAATADELQRPGDATSSGKLAASKLTASDDLEAPSPSTITSDETAVELAEEAFVRTTTLKASAAAEEPVTEVSSNNPGVPPLMIPTSSAAEPTITEAPGSFSMSMASEDYCAVHQIATIPPSQVNLITLPQWESHLSLPIASPPMTFETVSSFGTPTAALLSGANVGMPTPPNSYDVSVPDSGFIEHVPMFQRPNYLQNVETYAGTIAFGGADTGTSSMELEEPGFTTIGTFHNPYGSTGTTDFLPHPRQAVEVSSFQGHSQVAFASNQTSPAHHDVAVSAQATSSAPVNGAMVSQFANPYSGWNAPRPVCSSMPNPSTFDFPQPVSALQTERHFTCSASSMGVETPYMPPTSQDWAAWNQQASTGYYCDASSVPFGPNGNGVVSTFPGAAVTRSKMDVDEEDLNRLGCAQDRFSNLQTGFALSGSASAGTFSSPSGSGSHSALQLAASALSPVVAANSEQLKAHSSVQEAVMPISASNSFSLPAPPHSTTAQEEAPPMPDIPQSNALQTSPTAAHRTTALSPAGAVAASTMTLQETSSTSQPDERPLTLVAPNSPSPAAPVPEPGAVCSAAVPPICTEAAVAPDPADSEPVDSAAAVATPPATDVLQEANNAELDAEAPTSDDGSMYVETYAYDGEGGQDAKEPEAAVVDKLRDRSDLLDDFADFFSSFRVGSGDKAGKDDDEKDAAVPAQGSSANSGHVPASAADQNINVLDDDEEEECDL
ncbi:hypothetical protein HDU96_006436 [Phlyctochytrium bullatum]|nr:hypothetical protein HDU96_006436 [Phlyctochytrium bullatum]